MEFADTKNGRIIVKNAVRKRSGYVYYIKNRNVYESKNSNEQGKLIIIGIKKLDENTSYYVDEYGNICEVSKNLEN